MIKDKINELKKGCHKIVYQSPNQQIRCGVREGLCLTCNSKLQAYQEAEREILERIEKEIDDISDTKHIVITKQELKKKLLGGEDEN